MRQQFETTAKRPHVEPACRTEVKEACEAAEMAEQDELLEAAYRNKKDKGPAPSV